MSIILIVFKKKILLQLGLCENIHVYSSFLLIVVGWRCAITPEDHVVSEYEFDVLIGADGKRNTLQGTLNKY